jgi:hypothetical protein
MYNAPAKSELARTEFDPLLPSILRRPLDRPVLGGHALVDEGRTDVLRRLPTQADHRNDVASTCRLGSPNPADGRVRRSLPTLEPSGRLAQGSLHGLGRQLLDQRRSWEAAGAW